MKINKNIIKEPMTYKKYGKNVKATSNKNVEKYQDSLTAFNPLFIDTGKIIAFPEKYLYPNTRNHAKDFIVIDGKKTKNGDYELIGFICSSKNNKNNVILSGRKHETDIIAVNKKLTYENINKKPIKKSKSIKSKKTIQPEQIIKIKELSSKGRNINRSKKFKNKKEA